MPALSFGYSNIGNINSPYMKSRGKYSETLYGVTGWISSSGKDCGIFVPIILKNNVNSVNIERISSSLRHVQGGYVGGTISADLTSYIESYIIVKEQGLIYILLRNSDGWGIQNNTPVNGTCSISYTLS